MWRATCLSVSCLFLTCVLQVLLLFKSCHTDMCYIMNSIMNLWLFVLSSTGLSIPRYYWFIIIFIYICGLASSMPYIIIWHIFSHVYIANLQSHDVKVLHRPASAVNIIVPLFASARFLAILHSCHLLPPICKTLFILSVFFFVYICMFVQRINFCKFSSNFLFTLL